MNKPLNAATRTAAPHISTPLVLHARVLTGHGGGPDKTIVTAPRHYRPFGFDAQCLYLRPPNDVGFEVIRRRAAEQNATLNEIIDRGPIDPRVVWQAWRLCRRLRPAIWHGHDYKTNLLGLMLVRSGCSMRLATTVHGWVKQTARTPIYYRIDKLCLPRYEHVYCVSADQVESCRDLGVAPGHLFLLDNAIDLETFSRRRESTDAPCQGPSGTPLSSESGRLILGAMGRLSPEKGFDLLIRAVAKRIALGDPIDLVIAGDGDQKETLQRLIDELGLGNRIRLTGYCEDVIGFYESLDLFVLSSLREGLPNVLLEAMAIGVPILSTRVAGVPRLIEHGRNGWLVGCGDEETLADAIGRLIANPAHCGRMAKAARETVERQFSFEERARRQCELYRTLINGF